MQCPRCGIVLARNQVSCEVCDSAAADESHQTGSGYTESPHSGSFSSASARRVREEEYTQAEESDRPNMNQEMRKLLQHLHSEIIESCRQNILHIQKQKDDQTQNNKSRLQANKSATEHRFQWAAQESKQRQDKCRAALEQATLSCGAKKGELHAL